uniref:Uncharacterized protein n=1 Tax=Arundo donax TaxID=35708 RepID=A0A0A9F7S1_ARUDO
MCGLNLSDNFEGVNADWPSVSHWPQLWCPEM